MFKVKNKPIKVSDLKKEDRFRRIMIVKTDEEDKELEGKTGTLTNPFPNFEGSVGVFLDATAYGGGIANLLSTDKIKFIDKK